MHRTASLNAGLMKIGRHTPPTKPMVLADGQMLSSPHAATIKKVITEARAELGYDRPGFIRVEHPDNMTPGDLMGRCRKRLPAISGRASE